MKRFKIMAAAPFVPLMILILGAATPSAVAETYYISPGGSDHNGGAAASEPWGTFDHAVPMLRPGDTLILLDGVYTPDTTGMLHADGDGDARSGTAEAPITIRARNERRAWLRSDGSTTAFQLSGCSYWRVHGLRASSADYKDGATDVFRVTHCDHIQVKRLLLHHANRYKNSSLLQFTQSHHILAEDVEAYFFHRHGISTYQCDQVTLRRCFVHARNAEDLEDPAGYASHGCCQNGGDEGFSFYFTSNSILENCVSVQSEQLSVISGIETVLGNPGGQNIKMLGNISYKDLRPGFLQSRKFFDPNRPYTGPAKNILIKDFLVVGGQRMDRGAPFSPHVAADMTLDGATWINSRQTPINASAEIRRLSSRAFLGSKQIGGSDYEVRNALFIDNHYSQSGSLFFASPASEGMHLRVHHSNAWNREQPQRGFGVDEEIGDHEGRYQNCLRVRPTGMGLGRGESIVFVPENSNMSGAGADGGDIGANILYRYKDGELTDEPLWDPRTGRFTHGAVIANSPNDPRRHEVTLASLHRLLNVRPASLPYGR